MNKIEAISNRLTVEILIIEGIRKRSISTDTNDDFIRLVKAARILIPEADLDDGGTLLKDVDTLCDNYYSGALSLGELIGEERW